MTSLYYFLTKKCIYIEMRWVSDRRRFELEKRNMHMGSVSISLPANQAALPQLFKALSPLSLSSSSLPFSLLPSNHLLPCVNNIF